MSFLTDGHVTQAVYGVVVIPMVAEQRIGGI
jgi:hypothetical protein